MIDTVEMLTQLANNEFFAQLDFPIGLTFTMKDLMRKQSKGKFKQVQITSDSRSSSIQRTAVFECPYEVLSNSNEIYISQRYQTTDDDTPEKLKKSDD